MTTLQRPGRAAAVVGGMVAAGAATMMVLLSGTASAATAGTCTDNVNVRSEPSATSEIVAVCDRGTTVQMGQTKNGFVKLENLDGWASAEYVKANADEGTTSSGTNGRTPSTTTKPAPAAAGNEDTAQPATTTAKPSNTAGDESDAPAAEDGTPAEEPQPRGLLG
ncbi:SH3 domain-containing protein [Pseudonocardia sp.]|jgi:uncharacterized protein YraI|uniref:SH3 domain-containing protein n=1 Tax=Pseudonocardia sp. TaxID=60912 RepID=UPI0031FC7A83